MSSAPMAREPLSSTAVLRALLKSPDDQLRVRLGESETMLRVVAVEQGADGPTLIAEVESA